MTRRKSKTNPLKDRITDALAQIEENECLVIPVDPDRDLIKEKNLISAWLRSRRDRKELFVTCDDPDHNIIIKRLPKINLLKLNRQGIMEPIR